VNDIKCHVPKINSLIKVQKEKKKIHRLKQEDNDVYEKNEALKQRFN
jgi:hypothetical protein